MATWDDDGDWVVAGYGTQEAVNGPGGHTHPGGGVRMKAPVSFNALNDAWVRLAMTAPQGNGGACYGDSGGPNFAVIGGKRVLAATTITGDSPCYATNVAYRLERSGSARFPVAVRATAVTLETHRAGRCRWHAAPVPAGPPGPVPAERHEQVPQFTIADFKHPRKGVCWGGRPLETAA
ncbi:hypothetical protein [Streptomyces sp. NPDC003719]